MIDRIPAKPKIERIASKKPRPPRCGEGACQEMYELMNTRPDRVIARRDYLQEILECHDLRGGTKPNLEAEEKGRKYVIVDRLELMNFMSAHGDLRCDAPGDPNAPR